MKSLLILTSFLILSCSDQSPEKITGGSGDCGKCINPPQGIIHGKPAGDYYKQFKYETYIDTVSLKRKYLYLQSEPIIYAGSLSKAWSVNVKLEFGAKGFHIRFLQWSKTIDGKWIPDVDSSPLRSGGWRIENTFLKMADWGTLAPHASATAESTKFIFGKGFPDETLVGSETYVHYVETTLSL